MFLTAIIALGPRLPHKVERSCMILSPTTQGIVLIGGFNDQKYVKESNALLELSGHSIDTLEWTILDQTLQYSRFSHLAFTLPEHVIASQERTYTEKCSGTGQTFCSRRCGMQ